MLAKLANQQFTWNLEVFTALYWGGGGVVLGLSFSGGEDPAVCPAYTVLRRGGGGGSNHTRGASVQIVSVQFSSRRTLLFHKKTARQSNHFKIHIENRFCLYWPINQGNHGALEIPNVNVCLILNPTKDRNEIFRYG